MPGTAVPGQIALIPAQATKSLADLRTRVVVGSDFPNIRYPCAEQVVALEGVELGAPGSASLVAQERQVVTEVTDGAGDSVTTGRTGPEFSH